MSMTAIDPGAGGSAARSTRGRVPLHAPKLNGELFEVSPNSFTLTFSEGQHDSGSVSVVSTELEDVEGILNSPISFYFGVPPRTELFQGYVTEVTDEQEAQGQLSFTMQVMGPTKKMFEGKPRFWINKSVTSAIYDLVNTNGLGYGGHTDTYLWKSLAQTTQSDWQMLTELTSRLGWCAFTRYGIVIVYDPMRQYETAGCYTKLVSGLSDLNTADRNMLEFTSESVSTMIRDNLGSKFSYFTTSNEVQTKSQSGDYLGYVFETGDVVRDQVEAEARMKAFDAKIEGWGEVAVARVWGDADLFPGMLVQTVTVSKRFVAPKGDGCWLVRSVGHQGDNQQYQTILFLTRPANMDHNQIRDYKPFWEEMPQPKPRPSLTLEDKRWVSSWNDRQLRGLL
jgi:phage protein D